LSFPFIPTPNIFFHIFIFLLFKFLFYYWTHGCNGLSWRHFALDRCDDAKIAVLPPFKNYFILRIYFKMLRSVTSVLETCCDSLTRR
jgi:hypothetical protein